KFPQRHHRFDAPMLRCLSDGRPLSVVEKAKNERARSEFTLGSPSKSPFSHSSRRKSAQTPSKTGGRLGPITSKMRFEETLALTPASPTRGGEHAQFQGIFTPFGVALLHVDDLLRRWDCLFSAPSRGLAFARVSNVFRLVKVNHLLGHVGGVVGDPFQAF